MLGLHFKMYSLVVALTAILCAIIWGVGHLFHVTNIPAYLITALVLLGLQYLLGPIFVGRAMRVEWIPEARCPELFQIVAELAQAAGIPKPKIGISHLHLPNAFAYGRTQRDGRICITEELLNVLDKDEVRAVLAHEMSHLQHRDMAIITLLSTIPMLLFLISQDFTGPRRNAEDSDREDADRLRVATLAGGLTGGLSGNPVAFLGLFVFSLSYISSRPVLYVSRSRELYADAGSVKLGSPAHHLASALYKLADSSPSYAESKNVPGAKAFFVNDPSISSKEVRRIEQMGFNKVGKISQEGLKQLHGSRVRSGFFDKLGELFDSHPRTIERIKALADIDFVENIL